MGCQNGENLAHSMTRENWRTNWQRKLKNRKRESIWSSKKAASLEILVWKRLKYSWDEAGDGFRPQSDERLDWSCGETLRSISSLLSRILPHAGRLWGGLYNILFYKLNTHLKVDWLFDQPERMKMTPALREQLSEGERLNISFTNADCPTLSEEDKKDEAKVSPKIHMILPQH